MTIIDLTTLSPKAAFDQLTGTRLTQVFKACNEAHYAELMAMLGGIEYIIVNEASPANRRHFIRYGGFVFQGSPTEYTNAGSQLYGLHVIVPATAGKITPGAGFRDAPTVDGGAAINVHAEPGNWTPHAITALEQMEAIVSGYQRALAERNEAIQQAADQARAMELTLAAGQFA